MQKKIYFLSKILNQDSELSEEKTTLNLYTAQIGFN